MLNNYSKEDTKKWLFADEKYFDLDGIYTIYKTTEYGLPVEKKLTEKVVFIRKLNIQEK